MKWNILVGFLVFLLTACDEKEGVTPLMFAAKSGNTIELAELIAGGANVNENSDYDWTALMFASSAGHEDAVILLIDAGADVNLTSIEVPSAFSTVGGYGPTSALSEAITEGHLSIANILIDSGAAIDANSLALAGGQGSIPLLERMVALGGNLNKASDSEFHRTALNVAAFKGDIKIINWLLDNGADPNLVLPNSTSLSRAVRGIQPEAVEFLIDHGADPNLTFGSAGYTVLYRAFFGYIDSYNYSRNLKVIKILLKNGSNQDPIINNKQRYMLELVKKSLSASYEPCLSG